MIDTEALSEFRSLVERSENRTVSLKPGTSIWMLENLVARVSLLDRRGCLGKVSGLNWGQRENRNKNQAYLPLRGDVRQEGFLPPLKEHFVLISTDGSRFICSVQQAGRKALACSDNSALGVWIRTKLGLVGGSLVTVKDLEQYGRTDFTLARIRSDIFVVDF